MNFWFTLITFIVVTAFVTIYASKKVTDDDSTTSKGYFLAGSGLSGLVIAGSMMLTNLSAENLVGLSGQSYNANMSGMAWESTAVIATIVMAIIFLPIYLRKGYTTLPEFMEERYDLTIKRVISLLFLIGYLVIGIPVCLYAGAIGFTQIFDLSAMLGVSQQTAITIIIVLVGVVGAILAVFGGLKAVAVSDTINGVLLLIGAVLVLFFGLSYLGGQYNGGIAEGINDILVNAPEKLNAVGKKGDPVPFSTLFTGMILANLFYWGTNQVLIQRTLGAKNLKEGQKGVLLSGFLKMIVPLFMVLPGIIAFRLAPGLENSDFAYPTLVGMVLPWPLLGIFCAALFGAIVSTYNSFLNSASTIFMLDFYKPFINPNIEDRELVRKSKIFGTIFAIFAIVFSPMLQNMDTGLYDFGRSFTGFYNIPIITLVLLGMFTKWSNPLGAKIAIIWHILFYSGYKFWFKTLNNTFLNKILDIQFIHTYAISFVVMVLIIYICSFIDKDRSTFNLNDGRHDNYDMTPWELRIPVAIFLVSMLIYNYLLLSPMGLAAPGNNLSFVKTITLILIIIGILVLVSCNKIKKGAKNEINKKK